MVIPDQPFLDWLRRVDPTNDKLSLEDLRRDSTVYLLPECESDEETLECLEEVCGRIFEEELDAWHRVPSSWPRQRDIEAFHRWFEWSIHSMVVDLCDDPLLEEEV